VAAADGSNYRQIAHALKPPPVTVGKCGANPLLSSPIDEGLRDNPEVTKAHFAIGIDGPL
jgi:hypothetical protein